MSSASAVRRICVLTLTLAAMGCEANLETTCITGDNCAPYEPTPGEVKLGRCLETCDIESPTDRTGDYPCGVQKIMDDICTNCHSDPPTNGAPFPLGTYTDSQALSGPRVIYAKMVAVVGLASDPVDFMPLGGPPLSDEDRAELLDGWGCICAPPKPDDEVCE